MTEAQISQKIRAEIKKQAPNAVVIKHNDRIVRGVPDLSVTIGGRTTWIEVKYIRKGETPARQRKHFDQVQLYQALRLEREGRCIYFIAYESSMGLQALVIRPSHLSQALEAVIFRVINLTTRADAGSFDATAWGLVQQFV